MPGHVVAEDILTGLGGGGREAVDEEGGDDGDIRHGKRQTIFDKCSEDDVYSACGDDVRGVDKRNDGRYN